MIPPVQISTANGQLTLTKRNAPSLMTQILPFLNKGEILIFDKRADSLTRNGKKACSLSQFSGVRITKFIGGDAPTYGIAATLVDETIFQIVDSFRGGSLEDMRKVANAISRYTDLAVARET